MQWARMKKNIPYILSRGFSLVKQKEKKSLYFKEKCMKFFFFFFSFPGSDGPI